jgi:predicted transcriptional regulator
MGGHKTAVRRGVERGGIHVPARTITGPAIGRALLERRLALGMSRDHLAVASGLARSSLERYERGERSPRIEDAVAWSQSLGVDLAELIARHVRTEVAASSAPPHGGPHDDHR